MTERDWVDRFEAGAVARFGHADHVRVAYAYLSVMPQTEALVRFPEALRRFAAAQGKPELYHETLTWFWLLLIAERMRRCGEGWESFAAANADLLEGNGPVVRRYYRRETVDSEAARRRFVLPDRLIPAEAD